MESLPVRRETYHTPQDAPAPKASWLDPSSDPSKAYHATSVWGKRGMTLQELTRAFDAFNENEERVAIGFAWSEDCAKRLAEPLLDVKTTFSDLDGLRAQCSAMSPCASPDSTSSSQTLRPKPIIDERTTDEFGFAVRAPDDNAALPTRSCRHGPIGGATAVDEDTIKPSHKRRRSLSAVSQLETPEYERSRREREEPPVRPPSRLGFLGDVDDDGDDARDTDTEFQGP